MPSGPAAAPAGVRERAAGLFARIGCPDDAVLLPLSAGGNNRVYRVENGARSYLLKEYFRHAGDSRDRLGAEFAFARFAWDNDIRCIPEPIACDEVSGLGLYSFLDGEPITADTLCATDVAQATAFVSSLNRHRHAPGAAGLPPGSEACFSIARHLQLVKGRLDRLAGMVADSEIDRRAQAFVAGRLLPAHRLVVERIERHLTASGLSADAELAPEERLISPSDFGFHNALRRRDGTLVFLDFEYAGWDDPAKLIGDFFSQVAVPVPPSYREQVCHAVAQLQPDRERALLRMLLLLPLYRLKWCGIVLNHFLPVDAQRRQFAQGAVREGKAAQLAKAEALIASIEQFGI